MLNALQEKQGEKDAPTAAPGARDLEERASLSFVPSLVSSPSLSLPAVVDVDVQQSTAVKADIEMNSDQTYSPFSGGHSEHAGAGLVDNMGAKRPPPSEIAAVLDSRFYLTGVGDQKSTQLSSSLRTGRPPTRDILEEAREAAIAACESRVALLVCGPTPLVNKARELASELSTKEIKFDFHSETFDL